MNPLKWFLNLFPPEENDSAGWGPFRLPADCDWMQEAARIHDIDYRDSAINTQRRSESDAKLFRNWCRAADAPFNSLERCKRYRQICRYWPYVRIFGGYVWDKERNLWKSKDVIASPSSIILATLPVSQRQEKFALDS